MTQTCMSKQKCLSEQGLMWTLLILLSVFNRIVLQTIKEESKEKLKQEARAKLTIRTITQNLTQIKNIISSIQTQHEPSTLSAFINR